VVRAQVHRFCRAGGGAETGHDRGKQSFSFERVHVLDYSFVKMKVITF
jgi:hypothetical protein